MNMNPFQIMQMMQRAQNPMQMMQQTLGQYPQFQRALQMVKGQSPQELTRTAENLCQQSGLNFRDIAAQMRQMGITLPGVNYEQPAPINTPSDRDGGRR